MAQSLLVQVRTLARLCKAVSSDAPLILPAWLPSRLAEAPQHSCSWSQCMRSVQTRAAPCSPSSHLQGFHLPQPTAQIATQTSQQRPFRLLAAMHRAGWPAGHLSTAPAHPLRSLHTQVAHLPRPSSQCQRIQGSSGVLDAPQMHQWQQVRHKGGNLSRVRVPKSAAINTTVVSNVTQLKYGAYGIRALTERRVAANTIEAMRRTLRRRLKKTAALWVRIAATVPVTRKPEGIRMGKGKGAIDFYACAVRPGQIICEMDRVPRKVALSALQAVQPKFPCKLGFVEWS